MAEAATQLTHLQTLAALKMIQSEFWSKRYYNRRANILHSRTEKVVYFLKHPKKGKLDAEYVAV